MRIGLLLFSLLVVGANQQAFATGVCGAGYTTIGVPLDWFSVYGGPAPGSTYADACENAAQVGDNNAHSATAAYCYQNYPIYEFTVVDSVFSDTCECSPNWFWYCGRQGAAKGYCCITEI